MWAIFQVNQDRDLPAHPHSRHGQHNPNIPKNLLCLEGFLGKINTSLKSWKNFRLTNAHAAALWGLRIVGKQIINKQSYKELNKAQMRDQKAK